MSLAPAAVLRRQQQAFAAAVLGRTAGTGTGPGGAARLQPSPAGAAPAIGVYRQAYTARLVGALRDNFEILARALGDAGFEALATAYIAAQPSRQPSIRWFGDRLTAFMDQRLAADDGLVPHPALADLARMDWALRGAFDAADAPLIGRAALAGLPPGDWPGLCLLLHPSVRQVALRWSVEAAWHALRGAADGADGAAGNDDAPLPAPVEQAHTLLVWRRGLDTQWRSLGPPEAALLQALAGGANFGALGEQAIGWVDDADQAVPLVVGALQQWLADGLVSGWRIAA